MNLLRVVLVDDDDRIREVMEKLLAFHLPDIVDVRSFHPDDYAKVDWSGCQVALIDLMMPGISGEEILTELRNEHPQVYRVAWTAKDNATRQRIAKSGLADAVVAKPGFDDIISLLRMSRA